MKYIKKFESYEVFTSKAYGGSKYLFIGEIMEYLNVDNDRIEDESYFPKSPYDINVIDFFKEIFLNKNINFESVNKIEGYPRIDGIVKSVDHYAYKDEFYIKINLYAKSKDEKDDEDYLISNDSMFSVDDYDAYTKPLHKEVELKKEAEKYNI